MKRITALILLVASLILSSCGSVALTGRKQLLLVSDQEVFQAGLTQYKEYIASSQLSSDTKNTAMVQNVGQKLAVATEQYLKASGLESELKNFAWEFNLVKDNQVNEAQAYIAQMTKEAGKKGRVYCTGNQIADIVLTSILSKVEKSVEVKVSGNLRDNLNISDYDLCIVISNLVNNAVEAVHKQNALHSYIHITFTAGRRVVKIEVRNSLASEQIASASSLQTQKSDKKLHGLGLKNVRMIVDKYDGKMEYSANEDTFEIYAILKENSSKK